MSDIFDSQHARKHLSKRDILWAELERLHTTLGLPEPTETLTIEALQDRINERKREAGEPIAPLPEAKVADIM